MIQELLGGGATLLGGERKVSNISGAILQGSTSPTTASTTTATSAATTNTSNTTTSSEQQNLRCPRCDSSNTKFCYYNNYNLTQPRHFCKTCRRYWTKGGALRNVPIGGGCRKNKSTTSSVTAGKSTTGKVKSGSTDIIKSSLGFDNEPPSNPMLWASPHNSQLLALLRASQNPNPNSVTIKEEGLTMIGSHMNSNSSEVVMTGALNARPISTDPLSQGPIGLCSTSWRNLNNHQQQVQYHLQQQQHQGLLAGEAQNTGIHELYQRLRSASNYQTDHSPPFLSNNFGSSSSSSSTLLDPSPVSGADLGYWNPAFSWSNLSTTNGAFP